MSASLIELRDELVAELETLPGFRSVGLTRAGGQPAFVVSVDPEEFRGNAPSFFRGYSVQLRSLGRPISHCAWRGL